MTQISRIVPLASAILLYQLETVDHQKNDDCSSVWHHVYLYQLECHSPVHYFLLALQKASIILSLHAQQEIETPYKHERGRH